MKKQTQEIFFNHQYKYVADASIPYFKINVLQQNAAPGSYHHSPGSGKSLIPSGQVFSFENPPPAESGEKETVNTLLLFLFSNLFQLTFQLTICFSLPLVPLHLLYM